MRELAISGKFAQETTEEVAVRIVAALLLTLALNACATTRQGSPPSGDGMSRGGEAAAAATGTKSDEGPPQRSGGCPICAGYGDRANDAT